MKKIKLNGKLSLNKETISRLNDGSMNQIKGGDFTSFIGSKCNGCTVPEPESFNLTDGACSCMSCTGGLCNTCAGC